VGGLSTLHARVGSRSGATRRFHDDITISRYSRKRSEADKAPVFVAARFLVQRGKGGTSARMNALIGARGDECLRFLRFLRSRQSNRRRIYARHTAPVNAFHHGRVESRKDFLTETEGEKGGRKGYTRADSPSVRSRGPAIIDLEKRSCDTERDETKSSSFFRNLHAHRYIRNGRRACIVGR